MQSTQQISNPEIRNLVQQRVQTLTARGLAIEDVGHFAVVDSSDTVASIEHHLGVPFSAYEIAEQYQCCFDFVYVLDQAGKGVELFVPQEDGIDPELIAMCRKYAYLAPPEDAP